MKVISITDNDGVNSLTGFTTSIFFSGCSHRCKGCYSENTWNYNNGTEYTVAELTELIKNSKCKNVSLIGGDPFFIQNRLEVIRLIGWVKEHTNKKLYVWTGYSKEQVEEWVDLTLIDFLITDRFELENRNLMILLRGSTNQRIFCNGIQKTDEQIIKELG